MGPSTPSSTTPRTRPPSTTSPVDGLEAEHRLGPRAMGRVDDAVLQEVLRIVLGHVRRALGATRLEAGAVLDDGVQAHVAARLRLGQGNQQQGKRQQGGSRGLHVENLALNDLRGKKL